jgi:hypothetical protein
MKVHKLVVLAGIVQSMTLGTSITIYMGCANTNRGTRDEREGTVRVLQPQGFR